MKKGLQTLEFSFETDCLSHYGGLFLIQRFCNRLDLRRRLQRLLRDAPPWVGFRPVEVIEVLVFLLVAGIQRLNKSDKVQYDGGFFLHLLGIGKPARPIQPAPFSPAALARGPFASWCRLTINCAKWSLGLPSIPEPRWSSTWTQWC